jgi:hypothetical protein
MKQMPPEPAPIQRQRTGTNDRGNGGLIDPNTRTQLSEWQKCNPNKRMIQL